MLEMLALDRVKRWFLYRFFFLSGWGRREKAASSFALGRISHQILLPVEIIPDEQRARHLLAQLPPPIQRQFRRELEPTRSLDGFDGDLEIRQGLLVRDLGVRKHERAQTHVAPRLPVFGEDDLVEMRRHGHVRRVADDFVRDAPLAVVRVFAGQVQRSRDDADGGVGVGEAAAEILEMRPVVAVEAVAHLRAHVAQQERLVQRVLAPSRVLGGHLVAPVVAGAEVVRQLGAEFRGYAFVFDEVRVFPVRVFGGQRCGRDVLGDPERVSRSSVEGGSCGEGGVEVGDGAREAILEEPVGVHGRNEVFDKALRWDGYW